jgi:hypothetical protein
MTLAEVLRPYLWLAAVGFLVGFMTYIAMGRPADAYAASSRVSAEAIAAPVLRSGPASQEWNLPKRI